MNRFHTSRFFRYRPVKWERALIHHVWIKTRLRSKVSYRKCFFGVCKSIYFHPSVRVYEVNSLLAEFLVISPDNKRIINQFFQSFKPYGV